MVEENQRFSTIEASEVFPVIVLSIYIVYCVSSLFHM